MAKQKQLGRSAAKGKAAAAGGGGRKKQTMLKPRQAQLGVGVSDREMDLYIADISRYPVLSREEEARLARRYRSHGELVTAHRLVVANLRFVVKVAHEYRGYGLRLGDLIQEGNIGLMMAVRKFDPDKGYRLISYAVWWIRAYIQNFVIRSWSLVKVGTTQAQRKLFFKLRSERDKVTADEASAHKPHSEVTGELAERLKVSQKEVEAMESRMAARDFSLHAELQEGTRQTHLELLREPGASQEERYADEEYRAMVRSKVRLAMNSLNDKERFIIVHRLMADDAMTLRQIGERFSISRERARQIEGNVLRKLRMVFSDVELPLAA